MGAVTRVGLCERGWRVEEQGGLADTDLILIGSGYHTVLQRAQHHNAAGHGS